MTPENKQKYELKLKRLNDALDLKEPDRVPIDIEGGKFMINYAGYQMKDAIFDTSLQVVRESALKFLEDFDPDHAPENVASFFGEGPGHDLSRSKNMMVAGGQGANIDDDSIQQHIEYPTLLDEEFEEFFSDRTGWRIRKFLPRIAGIFDGLETLDFNYDNRAAINVALELTKPEVRASLEELFRLGEFYRQQRKDYAALCAEFRELGYPSLAGGGAAAMPFDNYSDNYRGTIKSLEDLYIYEEEVERYTEEYHQAQLRKIRASNPTGAKNGRYINHMLHKGIDGFMNDEHYERFYWRHMKEIMEAEISVGLVPMMFCEGKYNTRLKFLKQAPAGRKLFRFETIDMELAKKELAGVACIGGGFSSSLLQFATPEKVREECKRFLEKAMPGGGYIFRTSAGIDGAKVDNVIAMFETVREYGRYR